MGMRRKQQAILPQQQTQCLIESKLKCKCNTCNFFPDFTCKISEGPPLPSKHGCVRVCVCVFIDKCAYLFVCQVWNERRQLGDWRWGCINRLDLESSSLSCISIIIVSPSSSLVGKRLQKCKIKNNNNFYLAFRFWFQSLLVTDVWISVGFCEIK